MNMSRICSLWRLWWQGMPYVSIGAGLQKDDTRSRQPITGESTKALFRLVIKKFWVSHQMCRKDVRRGLIKK